MIKIVKGKSRSLEHIKEDYFNLLNKKIKSKNDVYYKYSIKTKLTNLINSKHRSPYKKYYEYISENLKSILVDDPKILFQHHKKLVKIKKKNNLRKEVLAENLKPVINYSGFRSNKTSKWLMEELDINSCPYCNRQYIYYIIDDDKIKLFSDFDHFYSQSDYPAFALSFYNLIPCCSSCNSRIKGSANFTIEKYLHPYLDSFNEILHFKTNIKNSKIFYSHKDIKALDFNVSFGRKPFSKEDNKSEKLKDHEKAEATAKFFKLEELYNKHKDIIVELIQKNMIYDRTYINDLYKNYSNIFENEADVYKMVLGNYVLDEDLSKRPLAKFVKDIAQEFKLLPLR